MMWVPSDHRNKCEAENDEYKQHLCTRSVIRFITAGAWIDLFPLALGELRLASCTDGVSMHVLTARIQPLHTT